MRTPFAALMQSKYFTPTLNSAIFDGPIRIYFAQIHESFALKIYFTLQTQLGDLLPEAKEISRRTGQTIMLMIYPTNETFKYSFNEAQPQTWMATEEFGGDAVIGVNGPREEEDLARISAMVSSQLATWQMPEVELEYSAEVSL